MRFFQCPAPYLAHITSAIERALAEGTQDRALRADDDPRVRALAGVPLTQIDMNASGHVVIMIGIVSDTDVVQDFLVDAVRGSVEARRERNAVRDLRLVAGGQD